MENSWISINSESPKQDDQKILIFTPSKDTSLRYRIIDASFIKKCKDATHWQKCINPKRNDI